MPGVFVFACWVHDAAGQGEAETAMAEPRYPNESAGLSRGARRLAQGRAGADREDQGARRQAPHAAARRQAQGGLRLPVGRQRQARRAREILRAVRRQGYADHLLMDVRPGLGQAVHVLHVADGWLRPRLVLGLAGRRLRRDRQGAAGEDRRLGEAARLDADPAAVRLRRDLPGRLQVPGAGQRRHAVAGDAGVPEDRTAGFFISGRPRPTRTTSTRCGRTGI